MSGASLTDLRFSSKRNTVMPALIGLFFPAFPRFDATSDHLISRQKGRAKYGSDRTRSTEPTRAKPHLARGYFYLLRFSIPRRRAAWWKAGKKQLHGLLYPGERCIHPAVGRAGSRYFQETRSRYDLEAPQLTSRGTSAGRWRARCDFGRS